MLITSFYGFLIVLASVVAAVAGLMLVRRLIPLSLRERNNTATGTIYAALYVMFGVSVGFSLFLTWQQYNTARQVAKSEAVAVEQVYRLVDTLPEPERTWVRDLAVSYARGVVEKEWPSMRQGQESPRVKTRLEELRRSVQDFQPRTNAQSDLYSASLSELDELEANRELRLLAVNEGIPYIVWVVLVVGGVLTVFYLPLRDRARLVARRGGRGVDGTCLPGPACDRRPGLPLQQWRTGATGGVRASPEGDRRQRRAMNPARG